jgi:hypothetical protein
MWRQGIGASIPKGSEPLSQGIGRLSQRDRSLCLKGRSLYPKGIGAFVPKGQEDSARGFNPGIPAPQRIALTRNMVELSRAF